MERWTWPFVLQQAFMGLALVWVLWALWGEVRALIEELRKGDDESCKA